MSPTRNDTKMTDQLERELISAEVNGFSLRLGRSPAPFGSTGHAKAVTLLQGALIAVAIALVTITIALQAAARFS